MHCTNPHSCTFSRNSTDALNATAWIKLLQSQSNYFSHLVDNDENQITKKQLLLQEKNGQKDTNREDRGTRWRRPTCCVIGVDYVMHTNVISKITEIHTEMIHGCWRCSEGLIKLQSSELHFKHQTNWLNCSKTKQINKTKTNRNKHPVPCITLDIHA